MNLMYKFLINGDIITGSSSLDKTDEDFRPSVRCAADVPEMETKGCTCGA
jgi:hypothetical protein